MKNSISRLLVVIQFTTWFVCMLATLSTTGQDIKNATTLWVVQNALDSQNDPTAKSLDSRFTSFGTDKVVWVRTRTDQSGEITTQEMNLKINKAEGNWSDVKADGNILYLITTDKASGSIRFKNSAGSYQVDVKLMGKQGGKLNKTYRVVAPTIQ
jgi:hypothetical protein